MLVEPTYIIDTYDGFYKRRQASVEELIWAGFDQDKEFDMLDEGFDFIISIETVTIKFLEYFEINTMLDEVFFLRKQNF